MQEILAHDMTWKKREVKSDQPLAVTTGIRKRGGTVLYLKRDAASPMVK